MSIELYEHQLGAIDKLRNGNILCAGVGTGKSRTALAYFYLKECNGSLDILVKDKDGKRINRFGKDEPMANPKALYIITTAKKRDSMDWEKEAIPFGIETITVDSWNNIKKYENVMSAFFIFDEQRVVGYGAWAKTFIRITRHNRWILLSATPADTWMDLVPVFIANGFYKNKTEFVRRHVVFSRYTTYPKVTRYLEVGRLIKLKELIMVNMKFIKPAEEHYIDIYCNYNKENYKVAHEARWDIYKNQPIRDASSLCQVERRICGSDKSRPEKLKELLAMHPKTIVFYNYDYELDILRKVAKELNITKAELNGHLHQPIPTTSEWTYFVQYAAGSEAWNCIETNTVIFYSLNYSYRMMEQSAGRISRLNTPYSDLYYYRMQSKAPIEQGIVRALKNKKKFNEFSYYKKIDAN